MNESAMKKHVTATGALHIGLGIIGIVAAIVVFCVLNFLKVAAGNFPSGDGSNEMGVLLFKILSTIIPSLLCFISLLGVVGGIGLLMFRSWARYVAMITSALSCFIIPIGTLIGVYSLWVLFQNETINLFESKTQA